MQIQRGRETEQPMTDSDDDDTDMTPQQYQEELEITTRELAATLLRVMAGGGRDDDLPSLVTWIAELIAKQQRPKRAGEAMRRALHARMNDIRPSEGVIIDAAMRLQAASLNGRSQEAGKSRRELAEAAHGYMTHLRVATPR